MWKPPAEQVFSDSGWRPPADGVVDQATTPTQPSPYASLPEVFALADSPHPIWDALKVPSQMAERGLAPVTHGNLQIKPTGNIPWDVTKNIPSVLAESVAEAAPSFINRASILTAGVSRGLQAMRPVGSVIGKGVAGQLESATGANPGSLGRAWNDLTLIFGKGKEAASELYEAGKTGGKMAANLRNIPLKEDFLDVANKLAEAGKLPAESALEARKMAGKLLGKGGGKYTEDFLRGLVDKFDSIAKANENIAGGDTLYRRGLDAASLRKLVPQNKYGGASAFKMGIMGLLGPHFAGLLSPAVHGVAATAGGLAARIATNPIAAVTARQALITAFVENRSQGSGQ